MRHVEPSSQGTGLTPSGSRMFERLPDVRATCFAAGFLARIFPPRTCGSGLDCMGRSRGYGSSSRASSAQLDLYGSSSKTSRMDGSGGCPSCGAICGPLGMPVCRFACVPHFWAPPTIGRACSLLPTPTAKANHCAPSMRRWPAYARFQALCGTGARPHPAVFGWLMGFPESWASVDATETPSCRKSPRSSAAASRQRKR